MRFEEPLLEAKLIRRYKRFLADVKLRSGEEITVHCANAGGMIGISDPGAKVLLSTSKDPRRKFKHQLEIIYSGRTPVGIHTGRPVTVISEAIRHGQIPELAGYATLRKVPKGNRDDRIDLVLEGNSLRTSYLCIENVIHEKEGNAIFPDAKHPIGINTIKKMTNLVREGNRGVIIFVAQRSDVNCFTLGEAHDGEFCETFRDAVDRGIETLAYRARVTKRGIELDKALPIKMD